MPREHSEEEEADAKAGYRGYAESSGNRSLVSGARLPEWHELPLTVKRAWVAAARAIKEKR